MQRRHFLQRTAAAGGWSAWRMGGTLGGTAALALPAAGWAQSGPPPSEAKAPALPELGTVWKLPPLAMLDGSQFTPEQARGQVVVVYWWASTCPFCALQSPEMQKLWAAHQTKGMKMLALSVDRKKEDALPYLQKRGYTFPAGWVTPAFQAALPKPKGLPITVVLGRDGKVLQAERGQLFPEDVEQLAKWWS